jgi:hypothetical protein
LLSSAPSPFDITATGGFTGPPYSFDVFSPTRPDGLTVETYGNIQTTHSPYFLEVHELLGSNTPKVIPGIFGMGTFGSSLTITITSDVDGYLFLLFGAGGTTNAPPFSSFVDPGIDLPLYGFNSSPVFYGIESGFIGAYLPAGQPLTVGVEGFGGYATSNPDIPNLARFQAEADLELQLTPLPAPVGAILFAVGAGLLGAWRVRRDRKGLAL